jgi:hypothetical protein
MAGAVCGASGLALIVAVWANYAWRDLMHDVNK